MCASYCQFKLADRHLKHVIDILKLVLQTRLQTLYKINVH